MLKVKKIKTLITYRDLCRIHKPQSKIVTFYEVQMVHNLLKQMLAFGFLLKTQNE